MHTMVDMSEAFQGKYLKAADYDEGETLILTIRDVTEDPFEDRKTGEPITKHVLHVNEKKAGLVLNPSNGQTLVRLLGKNSDAWIGQRIAVLVTSSPVGQYFKVKDKKPAEKVAAG